MADHRPFPPSPRRRALARRAGLHAASPLLVGAAAAGAAVLAIAAIGGSLADRLGAALAAACRGQARLAITEVPGAVVAFALPVLAAAAGAALVAHLAQTRALWLPRRRIPGAPTLDIGGLPRARRTTGQLAAAAVIAGAAFAWLWQATAHLAVLPALAPIAGPPPGVPRAAPSVETTSPRDAITSPATPPPVVATTTTTAQLNQATSQPPVDVTTSISAPPIATSPLLAGTTGLLVSLGAALAIAWLVLGVLDALARHAEVTRALTMTSTEKREDDRLAGADPRWQARRAALHRGPSTSDAIAGASFLLLGDDTAVAIAWDATRRPIPIRTATGRGPRATQLLGLARRRQLAVHADPVLAAALVDGDGPIPEPHWPRLATIIAAIRGRDRA